MDHWPDPMDAAISTHARGLWLHTGRAEISHQRREMVETELGASPQEWPPWECGAETLAATEHRQEGIKLLAMQTFDYRHDAGMLSVCLISPLLLHCIVENKVLNLIFVLN